MNRRVVVSGVVLLVVLGSLGWASAERPEAPAAQSATTVGPVLETGRTYVFTLPPSNRREELVGKVIEAPRGSWVKIEARGEALTHWINLCTVSLITPLGVE